MKAWMVALALAAGFLAMLLFGGLPKTMREGGGVRPDQQAAGAEDRKSTRHEQASAEIGTVTAPSGSSFNAEEHPRWLMVEKQHNETAPLDDGVRTKRQEHVKAYFSSLGEAMEKTKKAELWAKQKPELVRADCRANSCLMELEFPNYGGGLAFMQNFRDGRFDYELKVRGLTGCTLVDHALPRDPGKEQPKLHGLLRIDCPEGVFLGQAPTAK